jgi:hypothetical protein
VGNGVNCGAGMQAVNTSARGNRIISLIISVGRLCG